MDENSDSDGPSSVVFVPPRDPEERPPRTSQRKAALALILVTILERIAFYTVTSNLVYTLSMWYKVSDNSNSSLVCKNDDPSDLGMDSFLVITILIAFFLMCALFCVLGGWLGDIKLGRYNTILASLVAYIGGTASMCILVFVCVCKANENDTVKLKYCESLTRTNINNGYIFEKAMLAVSFILLALGFGLYKPNIAPFGADQLKDSGNASVQKFYNWFYFCSNMGSIVALTGIGYLQRPRSYSYDDNVYTTYLEYYRISYAVPVICIVVALFFLILGSKHYTHKPPSTDTLKTFFMIIRDVILLHVKFSVDKHTLDQVGGSRLELTKRQHGGDFSIEEVESVRDVKRIIPICLTFIIYWTAYSQFNSTYFIQGIYLERPEWVPLSFVQGINPLVIMCLVPLLDLVIYPALRVRKTKPSPFTKIIVGYTIMVLSLCCAAILGTLTRRYTDLKYHPHIKHYSNNSTTNIADISIFWTAPQSILVAISEVMAVIAGMEFAYMEAPRRMKSFVMGIFFTVSALGDIFSIVLVSLVRFVTNNNGNGWICNNFNNGKIDNFLLLVGGILALNTFWLMYYVTFKFQSKKYFNPFRRPLP